MKTIIFLLLSGLILAGFGADKQRYRFFENGKPLCRIVIPVSVNEYERESAKLIRNIFAQMGGGEITITDKPGQDNLLEIHLGQTTAGQAAAKRANLAAHKLDSFLIEPESPQCLVIVGNRDVSTFYGAAELLERYAGVLWVWPHENGTVIPQQATFKAEVARQLAEPAFDERRISGVNPGWGKYNKMNQETRERHEQIYLFSHNINRVMPPALFDTHPEYFNMLRDKRRRPVKNQRQACTSNPEVIQLFIDAAKRQFKQYPWIKSFSVSQNDGGNLCECIKCRALDVPGVEGQTDRYFTFANAVADGIKDEYPDKLIASLAYGEETRRPPAKIKLRPNVIPFLVIPSLQDPRRDVEAWSKHAKQIGVYFHLHTKSIPKFYPQKMAEYMNFLKSHKTEAVYSEIYPESEKFRASHEIDAPRIWLLGKIWWDPQVNTSELLDSFCAKFYGPAAVPMRLYLAQCEQAWNRTADPFDFRRNYDSYEFDIYTPADIKIMSKAFRDALDLAKKDPVVSKRLAMQKKALYPILAALQFEDFKPDRDPDDTMEDLNRRARAAARFNPEAPLWSIPNATCAAIDTALDAISRQLGAKALPFWQEAQEQYPLLATFIEPQIATCSGKLKNLTKNPSFTTKSDGGIRAWSIWFRPNTDGEIDADPQVNCYGKSSVKLEHCIAASIGQSLKVQPGSRYRISCQVQTTSLPATMSIHFKTDQGKWLGKPDATNLNAANKPGWQKLSATITVPNNAATLTINLGVQKQGPKDATHFSDLKIEPLYIQGN